MASGAAPDDRGPPSARSAASQPNWPERDDDPQLRAAARSRGRGTARRRRARRSSACWPAARTGRPRRCTCRSASGRRPRGARPATTPGPLGASAANRKSPDASPVKTRPVRLPPCAAGARPSSRIRASGSPKPGHRPAPVGLVAEARDLLAGDPLAPLDQPRTAPALDDLGVSAASAPVGHAASAVYFSSSRSSRRETTRSPTIPITVRYTTWISRIGADRADRQRADEVDALVERRQPDDELERRRVGRRAGRTSPRTGTSAAPRAG